MHHQVMKTKSARASQWCLIGLWLGTQYLLLAGGVSAQEALTNYRSHRTEGRSVVLTSVTGQRLRLTPYGNFMVRVQGVRQGEAFWPDDHYEMVEAHNW